VVRLLVCDDAPQFTLVTDELRCAGCMKGATYKKLVPYVPHHRALLKTSCSVSGCITTSCCLSGGPDTGGGDPI